MSAAVKRTTFRVCSALFLTARVSSPKAAAWSCLELCAESGRVGAVWFRQKTCKPVISLTPAQQVCPLNNSMGQSTQLQVRWRGDKWRGTTTHWDRIIKRHTHARFFPFMSNVHNILWSRGRLQSDSIRLWKQVAKGGSLWLADCRGWSKWEHLEPESAQRRHEQEGTGNSNFSFL